MLLKLLIASLLLCGVALAQPPHQGWTSEGPSLDGLQERFGPHSGKHGGEMHGILPPGRWWRDAEVTKTIGLNEGQIQKIDQTYQESRMQFVDVHAKLQKEEFKLEPLLEADNPDENAVLNAIDHITATRATLEKAHAQMAFAIRRILTLEQRKRLRSLWLSEDQLPPSMRDPRGSLQHNEHHTK